MAVNQVVYGGETIVDLTSDTVTPETLLKGVTAHDKSGNMITGTYTGLTLDSVYPVGSIYLAYNHTNPSTLFGGTWERIEGAFLWASSPTGQIGHTSGSTTHRHTLSNDGYAKINHHDGAFWYHEFEGVSYKATGKGSSTGASNTTSQTAAIGLGGFTDNINSMPPYIVVSVWRRTS